MKIEFTVPGEPVGKGRPRFNRWSGRAVTPYKTVNYENLVRFYYVTQCKEDPFPEKQMLKLDIKAYFEIPKSATKKAKKAMAAGELKPTKKPDLDNIQTVAALKLNPQVNGIYCSSRMYVQQLPPSCLNLPRSGLEHPALRINFEIICIPITDR